jgi:hypothetical protein
MVAHGCDEFKAETLTSCIIQQSCLFKVLFGLLSKGFNGLTQFKELSFGLSHQLHEDSPVASTASAEGTHTLFELLLETLGLALKLGAPAAALMGDVVDEL